jgi:hypothetical protein
MLLYNSDMKLVETEPEIYTADGKCVRTFFSRDVTMAYDKSQINRYGLWDRYNLGLPHHFCARGDGWNHEEPRALFLHNIKVLFFDTICERLEEMYLSRLVKKLVIERAKHISR